MGNLTPEEEEIRKRAIFDAMSPRGQRYILKRGYEEWNPFEAPKDPIDIRTEKTKRTTQMLVREFLQACPHEDYSTAYGRGVFEICHGIVNGDDASRGMFEFSCWYQALLRREGHLEEKEKK